MHAPGSRPEWQPYAPPAADASPLQGVAVDTTALVPATFGRRALSRVIDTIVGFVVGAVGGVAGGVVIGALIAVGTLDHGVTHRLGKPSVGSFLVGMLGPLVYHGLAEGFGGATIGKLVCGVRVVREDGRPATLGGAIVRNLAYYIDGLFFGAVAYSVMSNNPLLQRLGDKWGHTAVVTAASAPLESRRGLALPLLTGLAGWTLIALLSTTIKAL